MEKTTNNPWNPAPFCAISTGGSIGGTSSFTISHPTCVHNSKMLPTAYRGCAVALVGVYMGRACAWELKDRIESWKSKIPITDKLDLWSPATWTPSGQDVIVQQITLITVTSTAVLQAYPKITVAPIVRRKLGSEKWDLIHEGMQAQKRDGESCPTGFQLCPQSLNGGCCPNDRVCGASNCLVSSTSTAVAMGCGKENLFACSLEDGGKLLEFSILNHSNNK